VDRLRLERNPAHDKTSVRLSPTRATSRSFSVASAWEPRPVSVAWKISTSTREGSLSLAPWRWLGRWHGRQIPLSGCRGAGTGILLPLWPRVLTNPVVASRRHGRRLPPPPRGLRWLTAPPYPRSLPRLQGTCGFSPRPHPLPSPSHRSLISCVLSASFLAAQELGWRSLGSAAAGDI
jgi:hypothetical protein